MPQTTRPFASSGCDARGLDPPERVAELVGQRRGRRPSWSAPSTARIASSGRRSRRDLLAGRDARVAGSSRAGGDPGALADHRAGLDAGACADLDAGARGSHPRSARPPRRGSRCRSTEPTDRRRRRSTLAETAGRSPPATRARVDQDRAVEMTRTPRLSVLAMPKPAPNALRRPSRRGARGCPSSPAGSARACRCPSSSPRGGDRRGPCRRAAGRPRARSRPRGPAGIRSSTERSST